MPSKEKTIMPHLITQEFTVRYSFPVLFSHDVFAEENPLITSLFNKTGITAPRILIFVDAGILKGRPNFSREIGNWANSQRDRLSLAAPPFIIQGSEHCKNNPGVVTHIQQQIAAHHLCRQSFVMAIGGGAILDTVGYAVATAHRGVHLIRLPTTVLAQNDAGVGVKNGINSFGRKNFIGTFTPPFAVINDFNFLDTLPVRDLRAGIAEAVKVALIKDQTFFKSLFAERHQLAAFERKSMEKMIIRCAKLHIEHIGGQGDPFESGSARPLDFGHWSAHKLEEITAGTVKHGEAVAIGITLDSLYCCQTGFILESELDSILTLIEDLGLPLYHPALANLKVKEALNEFQEHLGGPLCITLLTGLGSKAEVHNIDTALMRRCINILAERSARQRPTARLPRIPLRLLDEAGARPPNALFMGLGQG